ncbi:related to Allantoate permease [Zygosaccharomyces bailii ISA1307]|nr:related to Allantoate permease [Zygosaccharomyces bailii ISA1307]
MSQEKKEEYSIKVDDVQQGSLDADDLQQGSIDFTDIQTGLEEPTKRRDADEAFDYALQVSQDTDIDPAADRKLTRKIDMIVFPAMALVYAAQFLDKTSMSYAAVMGLQTDLKMKGNMYSWSGTSFYLGYLVFEYPAAWLLQRFPLSKTLAIFLIIWGFVLTMTSIANYPGFIAIRTILGMLESSSSMGFMLLTAQYYHRKDQNTRTSFWVAFNGLGQIIGGSMAYGLAKRQKSLPMAGWKLVFIICGVITIFLGFVFLLVIPDTPFKAWFLNDSEKKMIIQRLRQNQQGVGNHKFKRYQFFEALKDVRTWIMFFSSISLNIPNGVGNHKFKRYQFFEALKDVRTWIMFFSSISLNIPNGGIGTFSSLLIKGTMGYDEMMTLLMGLPAGGCEFGGLILFGLISPFIKNRMVLASITTIIALIGSCLMSFAGPLKGTMGYDEMMTLLMGLPAGGCEFGGLILFGLISPFIKNRMVLASITTIIALIGSCLMSFAGPPKAQLAGYYLLMVSPGAMIVMFSLVSSNVSGKQNGSGVNYNDHRLDWFVPNLAGYYLLMVSPGAMIVMFSLVSSNVSGYTKKTTVGAIYLIGYCVGNLIGPQTFKAKDASGYRPAKIVMVAFYVITLVTFPILYLVNRKENKRRDKMAEEGLIQHEKNSEFADLTDRENLEFRYVL